MHTKFWKSLPSTFLVLAPMEDVTDVVFREIMTTLPRPDVFFTEFTSADALASLGRENAIRKFRYTENQRPIVAQIWGVNLENLKGAAKIVQDLGFDGVDINMGCPDKSVMKKGAGAALCKNPNLAKDIISAVREGAPDIALSVKTRLGYSEINTDEWITFLLKQNIDALTIHGRTATQLSRGEANWDEIGRAVKLRNLLSVETVIIGNGDIKSYADAVSMQKLSGVDGVMIGRGVFSNPWVFEKNLKTEKHLKAEYIGVLLAHLDLYEQTWGNTKNFEVMKKFFKMYVNNFPGASRLRDKLMHCKTSAEVREIAQTLL